MVAVPAAQVEDAAVRSILKAKFKQVAIVLDKRSHLGGCFGAVLHKSYSSPAANLKEEHKLSFNLFVNLVELEVPLPHLLNEEA